MNNATVRVGTKKRRPSMEERVAYEHLLFRGHLDVVYEPDGNITPDFLVDGHIAVEVRRLNQNDFNVMPHRGLEESEIPLRMHLVRLLASYGTSNVTRFIGLDFRRPLPKWSVIEKGARTFLDNVVAGALPEGVMRMVAPNVKLEYLCAVADARDAFELGVENDDDWGGWLLEQFDKNLRLCVDKKARKFAQFRSRYPEWWLVLIDQVAYGLTEHDRLLFRQNTRIEHDWDKIIIVSPIDHSYYFEM